MYRKPARPRSEVPVFFAACSGSHIVLNAWYFAQRCLDNSAVHGLEPHALFREEVLEAGVVNAVHRFAGRRRLLIQERPLLTDDIAYSRQLHFRPLLHGGDGHRLANGREDPQHRLVDALEALLGAIEQHLVVGEHAHLEVAAPVGFGAEPSAGEIRAAQVE